MWPIPMLPEGDIRRMREDGVRNVLRAALGDNGWSLEVRLGQTAREIRNYAKEIDATAIVMAAHPHHQFGHTISGVRAAQVLRGCTCPVLSVPPSFTALPRTIVAAVDFSPSSIRAAQAALLLAADDARLILVHVRSLYNGRDKMSESDVAALFDRTREELAPFTPSLVPLETRDMQGEVVQELLECVNSLGADLLAVGTHGPGLVERMFVGSVAASALHLARCTVLASPAPPAADAANLELRVRGTTTMTSPAEWAATVDAVSRRNVGRLATLEVDDRDIGAQIEAGGYVLQGIAFDPHDQRVSLMLESPKVSGAHLTRSIANIDSVAVTRAADGRDRAVAITHGRGQTLLLLSD
jgi:nucleotide-binding universal stress UspA family protein